MELTIFSYIGFLLRTTKPEHLYMLWKDYQIRAFIYVVANMNVMAISISLLLQYTCQCMDLPI